MWYKSTISQKIKIANIWKLILHMFHNIAHFLGQKKTFSIIFLFVNFLCILTTKSIMSQKLKFTKLFFHRFQNIEQLFGKNTQLGHFWGGTGLHVVDWDRVGFFHIIIFFQVSNLWFLHLFFRGPYYFLKLRFFLIYLELYWSYLRGGAEWAYVYFYSKQKNIKPMKIYAHISHQIAYPRNLVDILRCLLIWTLWHSWHRCIAKQTLYQNDIIEQFIAILANWNDFISILTSRNTSLQVYDDEND